MPTASVYYRTDHRTPDYVLINGDKADVTRFDGDDLEGDAYNLRAVDAACRTLGFKVMADAPIVRQADGRGTVRIEPVNPPTALDYPTVYVNVDPTGVPHRLAIDGQVARLDTEHRLSMPPEGRDGIAVVDQALSNLGYRRTTPIAPAPDTDFPSGRVWTCAAQPFDTTIYRDWKDVPTVVRVANEAADALGEMADKLGIPTNILASEWIVRSASDARTRYAYFNEPGRLMEHMAITGYRSDGSPHLRDTTGGCCS